MTGNFQLYDHLVRPLSGVLRGAWLRFDLIFLDGAITPNPDLNFRPEEQGVKV